MIVTTISSTIKPTEKAVLPLAASASLGKNGAPAAVANGFFSLPFDGLVDPFCVLRFLCWRQMDINPTA